MATDTVRMSSKGQIVIPQDIRDSLSLSEGTLFAVAAEKNRIILAKLDIPSRETLLKRFDEISAKTREKIAARGLTESDIIRIALSHRKDNPLRR